MTSDAKLNTDQTDDFDLVSQDPAAWYAEPRAVIDDASLTHAEKGQLLDEWARDLVDRSSAAGEGMVPEVAGLADLDAKTLEKVAAAKAELGKSAPDDSILSFPKRLWWRIVAAVQGSDAANRTQ